jgi:DNA helicase HerA-like ATPase
MNDILIGKGDEPVWLLPRYANRHGLIAGATGTGKSVSLMVLAEGFSKLGVPVFLADIKGDLAGLSQAGTMNDKLQARIGKLGIDWVPGANPVVFWDLYGKLGHPIRATVSDMGPILLARMLDVNDTQQGVLEVIFEAADDEGLLLVDLEDLRALLNWASENSKDISKRYGLISRSSIAAIQRAMLSLENAGGDLFFGEPALDLADFMRQDMSGRGIINVLGSENLVLNPRLYSSFLLWMLSEMFEQLPEVGDLDKPKLVFFFDEAHLLFRDAPKDLLTRVEQVVRLIRSKGVGVYFCSQNPDDLPDVVLGQMGNRIQHALRAFTPRDQKAVRAAAETFAPNPEIDVTEVIGQLGVGEALVSTLQDGGVPLPVERVLVTSPGCRIGVITAEERDAVRARSPVGSRYDAALNRESAAEMLAERTRRTAAQAAEESEKPAPAKDAEPGFGEMLKGWLFGTKRRQGVLESVVKGEMRRYGRKILRGGLGSVLKRSR